MNAMCPLCLQVSISLDERCGFEGAHIVPHCFMKMEKKIELTALYLVPSCRQCNNDCGDTNLLDFLWVRERYAELRAILSKIQSGFESRYPNLEFENYILWRILDQLYGRKTFPLGGYIQNATPIYQISIEMQFRQISDEALVLARKQSENAKQMETLLKMTKF